MNRDDVPIRYRKLYGRAMTGTCSPRQAIRLHCAMCMGWEPSSVPDCTAPGCPLFAFRIRRQVTEGATKRPQQGAIGTGNVSRQGAARKRVRSTVTGTHRTG